MRLLSRTLVSRSSLAEITGCGASDRTCHGFKSVFHSLSKLGCASQYFAILMQTSRTVVLAVLVIISWRDKIGVWPPKAGLNCGRTRTVRRRGWLRGRLAEAPPKTEPRVQLVSESMTRNHLPQKWRCCLRWQCAKTGSAVAVSDLPRRASRKKG